MIEDVRYYPEIKNEDEITNEERDEFIPIDPYNPEIYIKTIDTSGFYDIYPSSNKAAMRKVLIYVETNKVPYERSKISEEQEEELNEYEITNTSVNIVGDKIKTEPVLVESINGVNNEVNINIEQNANSIVEVNENFKVSESTHNLSELCNNINDRVDEINPNLDSNFNTINNVKTTQLEDVVINNQFEERIGGIENALNKVINITIPKIKSCLNVEQATNRINARNIAYVKNLYVKMCGNDFEEENDHTIKRAKKTPVNEKVINNNELLTNKPETEDQNLINLDDDESMEEVNNNNVRPLMLMSKRFRGINDVDISEPTRQTYYWNNIVSIDDFNEKYNKDYYGLFKVQNIIELPMLDVVPITINENNHNFVWDIFDDYINTNNNNDSNNENGYNPIGVKRFCINVDVPLNIKSVNYFEKINPNEIGYENYNTVTINPTPIKEDIEDNYIGDKGVTLYDSNEKIYVNNHKYTIQEENEELNENNNGFNSVIQTSIVPIMDNITLPEIKTNGTVTYRISDFNNNYMMPNSSNIFRNDFIGVDTINIPVNVNRLVIPLNASTAGVYHPTDYNPNAIGFSVVEVVGNSSGGSSSSVNNLLDYTFTSNSSVDPNTGDLIPYTIQEYNNAQDPVTNFTGFNNVKVNVPVTSVDNANVDSANNNVITSRTGTYLVPSDKTGWNSFTVNVPTDVNNADVDLANSNVITSRSGTYLVPSGKTGWNSFTVNVPTDVNNYDPYPSNNPLIINSNGNGSILFDSSNYTGLSNIYYDCQVSGATINNANVNSNNLITGNGVFTVPNGKTGFNSFEVQTQNKGTYLFNGISNYTGTYNDNMVAFDEFYELEEGQSKEFYFDNTNQTTSYRYFYIYIVAWNDAVNNYVADVCQLICYNTLTNGTPRMPYNKFTFIVNNNNNYIMKARVYVKTLDTNTSISTYQYKGGLMYNNSNLGMILANYVYNSSYKEVNITIKNLTLYGSQYTLNTINYNDVTGTTNYSFYDNFINKVNKNLIGFLATDVLPAEINNYQYGTQVGNTNNYILTLSTSYDLGSVDFNIPNGFSGLNGFRVNYVAFNSIICNYLKISDQVVDLDQANIIVYDRHTFGDSLSIPSNSVLILFNCAYIDNVPTYITTIGSCSRVYDCDIYINSTGVSQNTKGINASFSNDNLSGNYYLYVNIQLSYDSTSVTRERIIKVSKNSDGTGDYIINNSIKIISGQLNYYNINTNFKNNYVLCGIKKVPSINNN